MNTRVLCVVLFLPLLCLSSVSLKNEHAIYISVLEMEAAEMRIKVFSNDLETALINFTDSKFRLTDCSTQLNLLQDYFQQHIDLKINHQIISIQLKKCRVENDTHWLYFGIEAPENWGNLSLEANYFMEIFPTQSNIVQLDYRDKKQFARLSKQLSIFELKINE